MLSNAIALAVLSTAAFWVVYKKLPRKVRRFIRKHDLLADAVALCLTYALLGGTLTALVAAALVGLMTSALLYISNNREDFLILEDVADIIKDKLNALKELSKEWGANYREQKAQRAENAN